MWLDKYVFKAEWLIVICIAAVVAVFAWPDKPGVEVLRIEIEGYTCQKVIPFAPDHRLAICTTREECTQICAELNNK
jgi:hypothetical protein